MSFQNILNSIDKDFRFSETEKALIEKLGIQKRILPRQFLLQQGDTCDYFSFVIQGCFKMYSVNDKIKENVVSFFFENDWAADLGSFYREQPSRLNIEAIEVSKIIQFHRSDIYNLYAQSINFNRIIRVMVENKFIEMQDRVLQNISSSAEERYQSFLRQYPELANRIPNTLIASYLGITPEFLSKIRKNLTQKDKS